MTTSAVSILYYSNHQVYYRGPTAWSVWNGTTWVAATDPRPFQETTQGSTITNTAGTIYDANGAHWTLTTSTSDGLVVRQDGVLAGISANVIQLLYWNHQVWQQNSSLLWWRWTGADWQGGQDPRVVVTQSFESPSGASVTDTTHVIIDSALDQYGFISTPSAGLSVTRNGQLAGNTSHGVQLFYSSHAVYYHSSTAGWFVWDGTTWITSGDPTGGVSPPPTLTESADGAFLTSTSGALVDYQFTSWSLVSSGGSLKVAINGNVDPSTANSNRLEYRDKHIFVRNTSGLWWVYIGGGVGWSASGDPGRSHPIINLTYSANFNSAPAGVITAINAARDQLQNNLTAPITVNFSVEWADLGVSYLSYAQPVQNLYTYAAMRQLYLNALSTRRTADFVTAVNNMPAADPKPASGNWWLARANALALGEHTAATVDGIDGSMSFSSARLWYYDQAAPVAGRYDLKGAALSELAHCLGKIAYTKSINAIYFPFDLFSYNLSTYRLDLTGGPLSRYFSIDGGSTYNNVTIDGLYDVSDWNNAPNDALDYLGQTGVSKFWTAVDDKLMRAMGF